MLLGEFWSLFVLTGEPDIEGILCFGFNFPGFFFPFKFIKYREVSQGLENVWNVNLILESVVYFDWEGGIPRISVLLFQFQ